MATNSHDFFTTPIGGTGMTDFPSGAPHKSAKPAGDISVIEKAIAAGLVLVLLCLKFFYAVNQPWNSDEPQHLHVVWAWTNGLIPYKDVFDNHAPLFQALSAPVFALLGESVNIVIAMRWAITPISVFVLVMIYHLGAKLFSRRVALWGTVLAAFFPDLYFKLGEYRPDLFWCALWLLFLAILTGGPLTPRRLFWAGITLGTAFAVSLKTSFLLMAALLAGGVVQLLQVIVPGLRGDAGKSISILQIVAFFGGALIVPFGVTAFFAWKGALIQMYYCVIIHNISTTGDQWALSLHRMRDVRFWLFVPMIAGGIWMAKRDGNRPRAIRRLFLMSVAGFYCPLLFSFWPLISKQDFLPFFPIVILILACPLVWSGEWITSRTRLPAFGLPMLVALSEFGWMISGWPPLKPFNQRNFAVISEVLKLTVPGETVLDAKGQTIYRPRPSYYVFEQITREKVERGELRDDVPDCLTAKRTAVAISSHWLAPSTGRFINQNYLPVGSVLVLGKKIVPDKDGRVEFEIVIPAKYSIIDENGPVSGTLDGMKLNGPRDLSSGRHDLVSNLSKSPVFLIWSRALEKGFSPFKHSQNRMNF